MGKKVFFRFSKFWFLALWGPFFGHFRVFSSLSFVNLLYVLQVTPIDLQTWFLAQRVFMTPLREVFNDFWKCAFLPLLGALLFSKRALKGRKIKISKNKKFHFHSMSQGVLCQKIRFLGQKLWPVACEQTDTQTEVLKTENPIRASAFQASACDMSGPTICRSGFLRSYLGVVVLFF